MDDVDWKCYAIAGSAYIEQENEGIIYSGNIIVFLKRHGAILIIHPGSAEHEYIESLTGIASIDSIEQNGAFSLLLELKNGVMRIAFDDIHLCQPLFGPMDKPFAKTSGKSYSVDDIRRTYPKAYAPWSSDDDKKLLAEYERGLTIAELAKAFQRNTGAIRSRLKKLGINNL